MAGERLFLLDGSALAYRSFYAMARNPLVNSRGENTTAVYLFLRTVRALLERENPTHLAVVFDTPEPTFRHRVYPAYKATRQKMPDELVKQLPLIRELLNALGVPVVEVPGAEADDVIASLARAAAARGLSVYIVTRDKDFCQLVDGAVRLYDLGRGIDAAEVVDREAVVARLGVPPEKVVDVLALMGDAADNIPGVPGIGAKTAVELVRRWGDLDGVLAAAARGDIRGRVGALLGAHADQARLSRELVRLKSDLPLPVAPEALRRKAMDQEALRRLYRRLEFRDLLDLIEAGEAAVPRAYRIVRGEAELAELLRILREAGRFVVDTETTARNPRRARLLGLSFAARPHEAFYVPLGEAGAGAAALAALRPLLEDPALAKGGQNLKYDLLVLRRHGVTLRGIAFDTMVAAYLDDPGSRQHNLDALAMRYLGLKKTPLAEVLGGEESLATVPVEQVAPYACEDADVTLRLWQVLEERLRELNLEHLNREVEVPLIQVLADMEERGIRLDVGRLAALGAKLRAELNALAEELYALAGERFNLLSPKQLQPILYEKLRVHEAVGQKRIKRTKTGLSTDQSVLEGLKDHPFVAKLLEHRRRAKLLHTYVEALPRLVDPEDGRLHTSFNQTVTATGRLSSSEPNLQNIPIRTALGRAIREAFLPAGEDWRLVSADYSQVELRILAHLSGDPHLRAAFARGEDIHRATAALVFQVPPAAVDATLRNRAKAVNFGILYGMGAQRLARETGLNPAEARAFIEAYFRRLPAVRAFLDGCIALARKRGFVTTLLGRRRRLPEIHAQDARVRAQAEHIAVNTPIQGTAADLIKVAMVRIHRRLQAEGYRAALLLQVHDELLLEAPAEEVEAVAALVKEEMEGALRLEVPLVVDVGVGRNWLEAHP